MFRSVNDKRFEKIDNHEAEYHYQTSEIYKFSLLIIVWIRLIEKGFDTLFFHEFANSKKRFGCCKRICFLCKCYCKSPSVNAAQ